MEKRIVKKLDKIFNRIAIRDTLYNCSYDCANSPELEQYGKGIFVALVSIISTMNDTEINFYHAIEYLKGIVSEKKLHIYCNHDINPKCVPESWIDDFLRQVKYK